MKDLPQLAALFAAVIGLGVLADPIPELGFVLQGTGLGALIGTVVAQHVKARNPGTDTGAYVVRWTLLCGALFALFMIGQALAAAVGS